MIAPKSGESAPDFNLPSTQGQQALEDYRGQWVVLYFYPKDDTPGCTTEACDFRDNLASLDAAVLGVSADDLDSHEKFRQKYELPFPLLSDEGNELAKRYGAYGEKNLYGKKSEGILRSTFIIDPEGNIAEAMVNVRSGGHVAKVAERLKQLKA